MLMWFSGAVCLDVSNHIMPMDFALMEVEASTPQTWFLSLLQGACPFIRTGTTFIRTFHCDSQWKKALRHARFTFGCFASLIRRTRQNTTQRDFYV